MKHRVIELLDRLANYKPVPKKIKFTWIDYVEVYEYDEEHNWYFKADDHVSFSISNNVTLTSEFEIIEEIEKPKQIEQIMCIDTRETRDCIIKFQEKFNELIPLVNYLLKKELNEEDKK